MELQLNNLKVDAGGEGSRGGKIIGHTSNGKPIYGGHGPGKHKGFSSEDHGEAASLHLKERDKHQAPVAGKDGSDKWKTHHVEQQYHSTQAKKKGRKSYDILRRRTIG